MIDIFFIIGKHSSRQLSLSWYHSDGARMNAGMGPISMHTSVVSNKTCSVGKHYDGTELNKATGSDLSLFFF